MKSPLSTRPIRHHRGDRSETHIFQGVLALHILTAIEQRLKDSGDSRRWDTIKEILRTHQTCSVILPTTDGKTYRIRKPSEMEKKHYDIYE